MLRAANNIGVLAAVWALVMCVAALVLPHEWDWAVFGLLDAGAAPAFSSDVALVDVIWNRRDIPTNRLRVAKFLDRLVESKQRPAAVVLDIHFGACETTPCEGRMESARKTLAASIRAASRVFDVYAIEALPVDHADVPSGPLVRDDPEIAGALSGTGQTIFTRIPQPESFFYRVCYPNVAVADETGTVQGTTSVWSMVDRALMGGDKVAQTPCDSGHLTVRVGPSAERAGAVYASTPARPFPADAQFDRRYVIVGALELDRAAPGLSGSELLGWAMSNALDRMSAIGARTAYDTKPQNGMLAVLVPVFSGLAVTAFVAIFAALKRLRLGGLRRRLPWISAGLAAAAGIAIFAGFEAWLLAQREIQPQVTLIALGIVTASALCGVRGARIVQDEADALDLRIPETYDYDVFISYAHAEGAWVAENVYRPFREAALPNGKKLSIFFDTASIHSGTGWQNALALSIDASRFIVPVYSEIYFKQPYCRVEILRAHRRYVAAEGTRCVLPIMRGHPKILATVDDMQALSIDDHPDLVQQHIAEIVAALSRGAS